MATSSKLLVREYVRQNEHINENENENDDDDGYYTLDIGHFIGDYDNQSN